MYYKTKKGHKIFYSYTNKNSKKTPILFVHSFGMNWTDQQDEIKSFQKENFPVIYFDLPGHGKSDVPKTYDEYLFDNITSEINELLIHLKVKKVICVGYSMGGIISTNFTINYPSKIKKLIILNSSNKSPDQQKIFTKFKNTHFFKKTYEYLDMHKVKIHNLKLKAHKKYDLDMKKTELNSKNVVTFFFKVLYHANFKSALYFTDIMFNTDLKRVNEIECPVLILHSNKDQFFSNKGDLEFNNKLKKSIYKDLKGGHDNVILNGQLIFQEMKQFIYTDDKYFD